MRIAAVITFLLCAAVPPAHAKHFWANAAHLAGRTGKNMVMFHDKQAAAEEWLQLLGPIADGVISEHAIDTAPNLVEARSFLYGQRPSDFRYQIILAPMGFFDAMITQDFHEAYDGAGGRHGKHWLTLLPSAVSLPWSVYGISATEHSIREACRVSGISCR